MTLPILYFGVPLTVEGDDADVVAWCNGRDTWVGAPRVCAGGVDIAAALGANSMDGVKSKVRLELMKGKECAQ